MADAKPMVLKEFYSVIRVHYPQPAYPNDLMGQIVMPALRRSYDRARRDNWKLAKDTTARFEVRTGPVLPCLDHDNGELCATQYDDQAECRWCQEGVGLVLNGFMHQFGWYAAIQIPEEDDEDAVR